MQEKDTADNRVDGSNPNGTEYASQILIFPKNQLKIQT
jgi:hypothetical protein